MQFVSLRNAIKGVACAQTSVPLRNAIKISSLQKVVYTYVSLLFSALVQLWWSHCRDIKMAKIMMGERKKELGAWRENRREDRAYMQPQCCEVRVKSNEYKREQQRLEKQIKSVVVLINSRVPCGSKPHSHPQTTNGFVMLLCCKFMTVL